MCKRLFVLAALLMFAAPVMAAPVGIFEFQADIGHDVDWGNPLGIGSTQYIYPDEYLITAGGNDIWGQHDGMHYAYNEVSGSVRIEGSMRWQDAGWNDWTKGGVMLRESLASGSIHYNTLIRKGPGDPWAVAGTSGDAAFFQHRQNTNGDSGGSGDRWQVGPQKVAIQRINMGFGGYEIIQSLVDYGSGWEVVGNKTGWLLADDLLVGIGLTAGDNAHMHQFIASNVAYTLNPELVNYPIPPTVPGDVKVENCGTTQRGFNIRSIFLGEDIAWGYGGMNQLLDGLVEGYDEGSRVEQFVNLHDSDGRGVFENDQSFPGIDAFQQPTGNPADGDNDDSFATEITACIELIAGRHLFAINSDDGAQVWIGGVFVGQTTEWKGAWTEYIMFDVAEAGSYSLNVRHLEGGGGASLELMEVLADGTHVLMNDVANGASAVYVPEPATIALLGFGGLAMLRVRRKR